MGKKGAKGHKNRVVIIRLVSKEEGRGGNEGEEEETKQNNVGENNQRLTLF